VALLPLAVALIMLAVSPDRATRLLQRVRDWLLRNARLIAAAIMVLLAASLLRDGISGLTHIS
jgi:heme exporter protein D